MDSNYEKLREVFKTISEEQQKNKIRREHESRVLEKLNEFASQLVVVKKEEAEADEPLISLEQVVETINEVVLEPLKPEDEPKTIEDVASNPIFAPKKVEPIPDYITRKEMSEQYNIFLNKIQKQLSTIGGGGEVWFRWLDDVDRSTIDTPEANQEHVLRYNSATKKFFFGELTGDHREISSFTFKESGAGIATTPRMMAWNAAEDCLNIYQKDNSTLQVGLENYIQVYNETANTFVNGTVVKFGGVHLSETPTIQPYIADGTATPLFLIGVLTNSIAPDSIGRATILGKVRGLNTTGSDVGETWNQGDLLWGHPTIAGKMTKVRPSAPNIATSIAAVLKVGTTDGIILVRPTIWPRLFYGDWYDTTNQTAAAINTAYSVKLNSTGAASGFSLVNGDTIRAANAGYYNFQFSLQVTSTNSSTSRIYIWYRKNGVDAPHSATVLTIAANGGKIAPSWNFPVFMNPNDTFTLMWAADSTAVSLSAEPATAFCPSVPSVILTVSQPNL